MSALDVIVLSKCRFRKVIQARCRLFQPNSSKSSEVNPPPRNVPSENNLEKGVVKRKNGFGHAFLNLIKKSVPCIGPHTICAEGALAGGFLDEIVLSSRPVNKTQVSSAYEVSAYYDAERIRELEEHIPLLPSSAPSSTQTTPERSSELPSFWCAHPLEKPFATHSGSFYEMAQLDFCPPTTDISRLCVYDCPTLTEGATHGVNHRVFEVFLREDPLNIYNGSDNAPPPPPKPRSTPTTPVDSIQTETKPPLVRTSIKRERKKPSRPIGKKRRCHFKTRRVITSPRYTLHGVDVIYTRRKRFRRYKHLPTLSPIAEEDESTNADSSSSSSSECDSESVPSLIEGDELSFSSVFIGHQDCEDDMAGSGIGSMGVGMAESLYMAANNKGGMPTAGNSPLRSRRFSGLRPLLLPSRVTLRDA